MNNDQRAWNRYFTKEDTQRTNKYKKRLTSLVIREINIKTTEDITTHPLGWLKLKKNKVKTDLDHALVRIQKN